MATIFTHGFVGLALAPLAPAKVPRIPLAIALILLPVIPDIDVIAFWLNIPYEHPLGHRGFTHSLVFALALGYGTALAFYSAIRPLTPDWLAFGFLLSVATATHGFLDAFTNAGLGVAFLWPFDSTRYFFPWRPLETSPIGIASFFNNGAFAIMRNEFAWVWLPTSIFASVFYVSRYIGRSRGATRDTTKGKTRGRRVRSTSSNS